LKIRGDDVFGRRLTITYSREQTSEEMALEAKYAGSDEDEASIGELQRKLDELPYARREAKGR
jgi:hypothetical protein